MFFFGVSHTKVNRVTRSGVQKILKWGQRFDLHLRFAMKIGQILPRF